MAEAGRDAIAFVKQAQQFGLIPATEMIGQVLINDYTAQATGTALDGVAETWSYVADLNTPENKAFVAAWTAKFNSPPADYYAQAYNGMEVLFQRVAKSSSVKPLDVAEALSGATLDTIYGPLEMRAADHQLLLPNFIARVQMVGGALHPVLVQEYPASVIPPPSPACKM